MIAKILYILHAGAPFFAACQVIAILGATLALVNYFRYLYARDRKDLYSVALARTYWQVPLSFCLMALLLIVAVLMGAVLADLL